MLKDKIVVIENTKFIFRTNFAGDPEKDEKYHSSTRRGNLIIPDENMARSLAEEGFSVKATNPRPGEEEGFIPKFFVPVVLNYDSDLAKERPPKVYLVSGNNEPVLLDGDTAGRIDDAYVLNVNATLEKVHSKRYDKNILYIRVMYVEQDIDDDPFASRYTKNTIGQPEAPDEPEDLPFGEE
jgi:hypothetical protein